MHGGQAIPAFDFYLAPYVRTSFIEEVKVLEEIYGKDYSHLYHYPVKDYVKKSWTAWTETSGFYSTL